MEYLCEKDLLQGAKKFDLCALTVIYDRYSPALFAYSMRLLGDRDLAEDCVAETFSRFLKVLRAGQGPQDHLQAYLYRMAHNWITDLFRRQPLPLLELHEDLPSNPSLGPPEQAQRRSVQSQVRAALGNLTPDQRQVISLRFIEGWELEQVANSLDKPVGAVKALQHRALAALRKLLSSEKPLNG
jgi:RNA polymerase sigma-70 factor (ECF subfamily)